VTHRYHVYAVELSPQAAKRARDRRLVKLGAKVYYVGQTGVSDAQRLARHMAGGGFSNGHVRRYAHRLVGHVGPFSTRDQAERQERLWTRRIEKLGHVVIGGH